MAKDTRTTDTHPLGHSVSHTDTAQGKGGGRLTEKPETGTPGTETAGQGDPENAKSRDFRSPSGGQHGQDPQEVADRTGKTGKDLGIK